MEFVSDEPVMIIDRYIVVSDIHIGIGRGGKNKYPKGISNTIDIEKVMERKIINVKNRFKKVDKIILLGDIKDDIFSVSSDVYHFLNFLKENFREVIIVKGNHDANIETVPGITVYPSSGFILKIGKTCYGFAHGHSWPDEKLMLCDYLIIGHQHMYKEIIDAQGKAYFKKVWVVAKKIKIKNAMKRYKKINKKIKLIIMPAFNPLLSGTKIEKGIGPIFKNNLFDMAHMEIYSLSGILLRK